jgi:hypothetical protein
VASTLLLVLHDVPPTFPMMLPHCCTFWLVPTNAPPGQRGAEASNICAFAAIVTAPLEKRTPRTIARAPTVMAAADRTVP